MPTYRELLNDSATPVMVRRIIALLTDEKGHSRYDPVDVVNNLEVLLLAAKAELEAISIEGLHQAARDFMDKNTPPHGQLLSLDEWLMEYDSRLSNAVKTEGLEILEAFSNRTGDPRGGRRRTMARLAAELRLKASRETSNDNI